MACRPAGELAGCAASTALAYFHWLERNELIDEAPAAPARTKFKVVESSDGQTIEGISPTRIRTLEDAIAFAEVDTKVWRVKTWECTSWEVVMKMKGGKDQPDQAERHGLWRVSLKLERLAPKFILDGLDAIFDRMKDAAKGYHFDLPHVAPRETGGTMMEINIPDLHLGKLCWAPETGGDYDLKIAEEVYDQTVVDLLKHAKTYDPEQIVFLLGSDFFHYDTPAGTTTAGTPLDRDGRLAKMFEIGFQMQNRSIRRALAAARRVKAVLMPGNHDAVSSFCLARAVAAQFHMDDRVSVDYGPCVRKYVQYGVNLIGLAHGNGVKRADLPLIMATERPKEWAATTCREWHLGHLHTSKAFETKTVDEHKGVIVRIISSLSGTDAWHYENGYVGNRRAGEAFVYEKDRGFVANLVAAA
jgi:hypothetical protein